MNLCRTTALLFVVMLAAGLSLAAQANGNWRQLPLSKDGKLNESWVQIGHGGWEAENGTLRTKPDSKGIGLLVYKPQKFERGHQRGPAERNVLS
jgi:hypothetical protein